MATTPRPKAIYVGVPAVRDYLTRIRPDWDFAEAVPDIQSLWTGLDDGSIDSNSQILLVLDIFFDEKGEDRSFEQLVITMAPHCFVGVISYKPELQGLIRERIEQEAYGLGAPNLNYYIIDSKKPAPTLESAIARFAKESENYQVVSEITGQEAAPQPVHTPEVTPVAPVSQDISYLEDDDDDEDNPYLGQVVAVTSSKGGSGKSTVAITLATYLAHSSVNSVREGLEDRPLKVAILDLDVRDGQLGFVTGNSKPTVIQLRLKGVSKESVEETGIHSPRLKCDLFLAPKRPRNSDDTPPDFYVELIHTLRKMYDYVILDTSVNYLDPLLEKVAYPTADQIIFVTDIVVNSVFSMTRWIQEVTKPKNQTGMGISKNKIGIVVNKSLTKVAMPPEKIAKSSLGIPILTAIPSNPKIMAHAANIQSMEVLLQHQDIYVAIRRLARAITGKKYRLSDRVD